MRGGGADGGRQERVISMRRAMLENIEIKYRSSNSIFEYQILRSISEYHMPVCLGV